MYNCTYFSSCFRPEQKSTLSIVADVLGADGGFAGKYSTIAKNNKQLHAHSISQNQQTGLNKCGALKLTIITGLIIFTT